MTPLYYHTAPPHTTSRKIEVLKLKYARYVYALYTVKDEYQTSVTIHELCTSANREREYINRNDEITISIIL